MRRARRNRRPKSPNCRRMDCLGSPPFLPGRDSLGRGSRRHGLSGPGPSRQSLRQPGRMATHRGHCRPGISSPSRCDGNQYHQSPRCAGSDPLEAAILGLNRCRRRTERNSRLTGNYREVVRSRRSPRHADVVAVDNKGRAFSVHDDACDECSIEAELEPSGRQGCGRFAWFRGRDRRAKLTRGG